LISSFSRISASASVRVAVTSMRAICEIIDAMRADFGVLLK
jgi:hypothetical protein